MLSIFPCTESIATTRATVAKTTSAAQATPAATSRRNTSTTAVATTTAVECWRQCGWATTTATFATTRAYAVRGGLWLVAKMRRNVALSRGACGCRGCPAVSRCRRRSTLHIHVGKGRLESCRTRSSRRSVIGHVRLSWKEDGFLRQDFFPLPRCEKKIFREKRRSITTPFYDNE